MNYGCPDVASLVNVRLAQLNDAFNAAIVATAAASSVRVADVFGTFNHGGPQPATLCALTFVCTPLQDSHPTDLGYEVIARQVWTASSIVDLTARMGMGSVGAFTEPCRRRMPALGSPIISKLRKMAGAYQEVSGAPSIDSL